MTWAADQRRVTRHNAIAEVQGVWDSKVPEWHCGVLFWMSECHTSLLWCPGQASMTRQVLCHTPSICWSMWLLSLWMLLRTIATRLLGEYDVRISYHEQWRHQDLLQSWLSTKAKMQARFAGFIIDCSLHPKAGTCSSETHNTNVMHNNNLWSMRGDRIGNNINWSEHACWVLSLQKCIASSQ